MKRRDFTNFYVVGIAALIIGLAAAQGLVGSRSKIPVGSEAPDFTVPRLGGGSWTLSSLRGNVVLIDFWARWCDPCVKMMPALERLHQKMQGRPFQLLSINIEGAPADEVQEWLRRRGLTFPVGQDTSGRARSAYQVSYIPLLVLVGPDGTVRSVYDAGASEKSLEADVAALLSG